MLSRRQFLTKSYGIGSIALASLLRDDPLLANPAISGGGGRDHFDTLPRPFLMHCKSGADRAGLASALYLLDQCGASVGDAREMLSFRYLHLRRTATGVLDHMLDLYAARLNDGPIPVRAWIANEYDPEAVAASWAAR